MPNLIQKLILVSVLAVPVCLGNVAAQQPGPGAGLFTFHSGFWINLHHFMYNQALLQRPDKGAGSRRVIYKDTVRLNSLDDITRQHWLSAIAYYTKNIIRKDLLSDTGLIRIKNVLEDKEDESVLAGPELPADLETVLNGVAQSYSVLFWKEQDRNNRQWIKWMQPLVGQLGDTLRRALQRKYLAHWPVGAIRVDVTNYASWSAAYTTDNPTRISISSTDSDNQGTAGLEVLFHEASHILIDSISDKIDEICLRDKKSLPDPMLWHAILFYTTGEVIKRHFPGYIPYAYKSGLWTRAWPMYIDYLEKDWQPYLEGKVSFDRAIEKLVRDVEVQGI
jgi:hypothetical protein